jgi:prevent-host-death family protein
MTHDASPASLSSAEARERFDELLKRAVKGKERVILTRHGKPIAALVPFEDVEFLKAVEDWLDADEFRRAQQELEGGEPAIPLEEVIRKLGIKA